MEEKHHDSFNWSLLKTEWLYVLGKALTTLKREENVMPISNCVYSSSLVWHGPGRHRLVRAAGCYNPDVGAYRETLTQFLRIKMVHGPVDPYIVMP